MKKRLAIFLLIGLLLAGCGTPAQPPTPIALPTELPTVPASVIMFVSPVASVTPNTSSDPTVFGTISASEVQGLQASALESVANAIFKKAMDALVANGSITAYQVISLTVLPGDVNLVTEIKYNVQSSDPAWLADGGAQAADGWINGDCSRFDLFITDTEFQLKNRRLCS